MTTTKRPAKAPKKQARKQPKAKSSRAKTTAQAPANPPHRPSSFDPAYCDRVIECARRGGTLDTFAAQIRVNRSTLTRWAQDFEDFRTAIADAKTALAARLHSEAMDSNSGPAIAYRLKLLANFAPEDYRDRTEVAHGGIAGAPPIAVADLSKEDAYARYNAMIQAAHK